MKPYNILIIEDDEICCGIIAEFLSLNNCLVDITHNAKKAYEYMSTKDYDLYVVDLYLPDENGNSICKKIKNKHNVPVIVCSASTRESDVNRAILNGADDFLFKPIHCADLIIRAKGLIYKYKKMQCPIEYHMNGVFINKFKKETYVDGTIVHLSPTEFKILSILMEAGGQIVSSKHILNEIWGENENNLALLATNITRLRQKIGKDKITTIKNQGYKFQL